MIVVVFFCAAALITAVSLAYLPMPYIWLLLAWVIALVVSAKVARRTSVRVIVVNVTAIVFAIWALEAYQTIKTYEPDDGGREGGIVNERGEPIGYQGRHDMLGFAPVPNTRGIATNIDNGKLIYVEHFSINEKGLRVAPPDRGGADIDCILFFGGSDTFGNGLQDDETLPYQTGVKLGGAYRVHNFGASAYAPHQMLAALESNVVDNVVDCRPRYIVYVTSWPHVSRVGGHASWNQYGARYVFDDSGEPERRGFFNDPLAFSVDPRELLRIADRSILYRKVFGGRIRKMDLRLLTAIMDKSKRLIEERYPDAEFHVVVHGHPRDRRIRELIEVLRTKNLRVHTMREIAPENALVGPEYQIPGDGHPTALANSIIADYIVTEIMSE